MERFFPKKIGYGLTVPAMQGGGGAWEGPYKPTETQFRGVRGSVSCQVEATYSVRPMLTCTLLAGC